jgi:CheY-like chemotaxis protein
MDEKLDRLLNVLLVEDNPGDRRLIEKAFRNSDFHFRLHVVWDGLEALAFLHRRGRHAEAEQPDLILLDLNLPRKNGRAVLAEIKADDRLRRIPVIVFTTSQSEKDVHGCYNLHANCYITKPDDLGQFIRVVEAIKDFWLGIVRLPTG